MDNRKAIGVSFSRSSGKGGQNVNKVATKVELRVSLNSDWLPENLALRLAEQQRGRVNKERELIVTSQRHRTQKDNFTDAFNKLQMLVEEANELPEERIDTDIPEWSRKKRSQDKKRQSSKKSLRRTPSMD